MSDHPEFPQESPAIKYIVDQVSKVEDASNCSVGYYKSLAKIISRLDKTDVELNRLHQVVLDLKKITDSDTIAACIGKKSDEIQETLYEGITKTSNALNATTAARLDGMRADHTGIIATIDNTNEKVEETQKRVAEQMKLTLLLLDNHIKDTNERLAPPVWKIWVYIFLAFFAGALIYKRVM
jgi:uncharacterized coiled-coil DUF342 family protein